MIIIVAAILAGMTLIVMALVQKTKKETRKKRKNLNDKIAAIARENGFEWSQTDTSIHRAIAWFSEKRLLLFIDFVNENERIRRINMNEIEHCIFNEKGIVEIAQNKSSHKHITRVELELHYKEKSKAIETLQFYNEINDGLMERVPLTEKAKYWQAVIMQS